MTAHILGNMHPDKIAEYLREIGDEKGAERFEALDPGGQSLSLFGQDAWQETGMVLGFIAPETDDSGAVQIQPANALSPDPSLRNTRVKISMERFWVHQYPGLGSHKILCEFTGKNQIDDGPEDIKFALPTEARDGSAASISGATIFLGASVGDNGIDFEGRAINVSSSTDDYLLTALGGSTFRDGLKLLTAAQPALKPFVTLTSGIVSAILERSKNKTIFEFRLGLDFSEGATSACLRHGSYVIVQGSPSGWDWKDWVWNSSSNDVVRRTDGYRMGYNYMVVRVSPFFEPTAS